MAATQLKIYGEAVGITQFKSKRAATLARHAPLMRKIACPVRLSGRMFAPMIDLVARKSEAVVLGDSKSVAMPGYLPGCG